MNPFTPVMSAFMVMCASRLELQLYCNASTGRLKREGVRATCEGTSRIAQKLAITYQGAERMAKSAEVSRLEKDLDAVLAKLLAASGGSRSTLRIDDGERGWNVDFVCAEALKPGVKS